MNERTADRILYALKATGTRTARQLAQRLEVTPVAVRQHLERLSDEGLVAFEDRRGSVGRPRRYWSLSDRGHARFPDNHAGLTLELLESVRATFGSGGMERLLRQREQVVRAKYLERLVGIETLPARLAALAALRSEEGYMAEWRAEPDGGFLLIENHCPICAAARACQGLCRSELALFQELLGPQASVERTEHLLAGARRCVYRIRPFQAQADPQSPRR